MQRRDVLRLLTSSAVVSALPLEMLQSLRQARAEAAPHAGLRTLDAHGNATVTTICELIIPETATPGARGTKVNEFIDLILTEWYDRPDTERFLQGIADADSSSRKRFGKDFVHCSVAEQTELMQVWDAEAMRYSQAAQAAQRAKTAAPTPNFFYNVKRLTLIGYYTSEIGFSKELGATIIPLKHAGCAPLSEARS